MEKYSFSKLTSFHTCKYGYYLRYIAGEKGEGNAFAEYGSFMHGLLEEYAVGTLEAYELCAKYTEKFAESVVRDFPSSKFADLRETYFRDGYNYLKNFEGWEDYKILGAEKDFSEIIENDFTFGGFIDLILEDQNGGIIIIDHKSKSKFAARKEQKEYARQLYLYCIPVLNTYGKFPVQMVFNMFRKQKSVVVPFNKIDYDESYDWMIKTVGEIRKCNEFGASLNDFMCKHLCDYRNVCENAAAIEAV